MTDVTTNATRTVDGVDLPAAGTWEIDGSHSAAAFSVKHLMVSKVRGRFGSVQGAITIADEPTASSVAVTIDAASIDTNDAGRDEHLRSADFFDVEQFPVLTYRSTAVRHVKGSRWEVEGDLTIRGVTRPVVLDTELLGATVDPWGNERVGFFATTEVNREDFGLTWNQVLETGGLLVGKNVKIQLEVEAVRS